MKPSGFEGRFLQMMGEGNTLLSWSRGPEDFSRFSAAEEMYGAVGKVLESRWIE